jgi:hypothetical protein
MRRSTYRRLLVLAAAALVYGVASEAHAKIEKRDPDAPKFGKNGRGLGVGVSLGDPLGFSLKYFIRPAHAISAELGWGILHNGDGIVSVSYHWHSPVIGKSPIVDTHFYAGIGLGVGFWAKGDGPLNTDDRGTGGGAALLLRAPAIGLAYHWQTVPLDTSLELAWSPYIILPELRHLDAAIKIRYFF